MARADAVLMLTQDDKTNLLGAVRARQAAISLSALASGATASAAASGPGPARANAPSPPPKACDGPTDG